MFKRIKILPFELLPSVFDVTLMFFACILDVPWMYLGRTFPLFCIYQKTNNPFFFYNYEFSLINCPLSMWIVICINIRFVEPFSFLSRSYPLATPLLDSTLKVAFLPLFCIMIQVFVCILLQMVILINPNRSLEVHKSVVRFVKPWKNKPLVKSFF